MDADALLAGPRGRGLLLALLDSQEVRELTMRADHAARSAGTGFAFGWFDSAQPRTGLGRISWVRQRRAAKQFRENMARPVTVREIVEVIAPAVPAAAVTQQALAEAFARTVNNAKYWQEPDRVEALLATPEVVEVLRPLAQRVAAAAPWDAPVAAPQWAVEWEMEGGDQREPEGPDQRKPLAPATLLAQWTAESTSWWTVPPLELPTTTGSLPGLRDVPAGLLLVEDSLGIQSARVSPVMAPSSNVLELTRVAEFVRLVKQHPSRPFAHDDNGWRMTTGRSGAWIMPDWPQVAKHWDGVHLTHAAYLEGATRALDCGDRLATIIAGWSPDVTYWFIPAPASGPSVQWRHGDQLGWRAQP